MQLKLHVLIASICLLLAGCQSVPYYERQPQFSPAPQPNQGRLLISRFNIPKADIGLFLYALLAPQQPPSRMFQRMISIYDVTEEIRYIGTMTDDDYSTWLEYNVHAGMRTLMLTRTLSHLFPAQGGHEHTDFLEIEVQPGVTHHVAISTHGFNQETYFGQLTIEDRHRDACSSFGKLGYRPLNDAIEAYMTQNGIHPQADTFKPYCRSLARPYIVKPNANALSEFNKARPAIEALRKNNYTAWKQEGEKAYAPYDVARPDPRFVNADGSVGTNLSDSVDFPK
ncbi:MAG: hypothetical protein WC091_20010 [Sulfuricellaceae bacterium]